MRRDKYDNVPMCCGTPLREEKCSVCGEKYNDRDEVIHPDKEEKKED